MASTALKAAAAVCVVLLMAAGGAPVAAGIGEQPETCPTCRKNCASTCNFQADKECDPANNDSPVKSEPDSWFNVICENKIPNACWDCNSSVFDGCFTDCYSKCVCV